MRLFCFVLKRFPVKEGIMQYNKKLIKFKFTDTNDIPPLDIDSLELPPKKFDEDIEMNQDKDKGLDIDF